MNGMVLVAWIAVQGALSQKPTAGAAEPVLARSIALPGVEGRIDHLAYDPDTKRLFVAARDNGSLEVVDLEKGERVKSITGLKEPQGIALAPGQHEVVVGSGGDGTLRAFDTRALEPTRRVDIGADADNVRFDPRTKSVLVGHGAGAIEVLGAATFERRGSIALPGHPESFQLAVGGAAFLYVNVPDGASESGGLVILADMGTKSVVSRWPIAAAGRNYPMALAAIPAATGEERRAAPRTAALHSRELVCVACRKPAKLIVIDAGNGDVASVQECVGDADDVFFDKRTARVFVIGGGGALEVFQLANDASCKRISSTTTAPGARTGVFVPELRNLFIAVPKRDGQACELREYRLAD